MDYLFNFYNLPAKIPFKLKVSLVILNGSLFYSIISFAKYATYTPAYPCPDR